jgi:hypothetical protein
LKIVYGFDPLIVRLYSVFAYKKIPLSQRRRGFPILY